MTLHHCRIASLSVLLLTVAINSCRSPSLEMHKTNPCMGLNYSTQLHPFPIEIPGPAHSVDFTPWLSFTIFKNQEIQTIPLRNMEWTNIIRNQSNGNQSIQAEMCLLGKFEYLKFWTLNIAMDQFIDLFSAQPGSFDRVHCLSLVLRVHKTLNSFVGLTIIFNGWDSRQSLHHTASPGIQQCLLYLFIILRHPQFDAIQNITTKT